MSSVDVRLASLASPERARSLFTVRAAISSATSSPRPRSSRPSLMCSYWRSRLSFHACWGIVASALCSALPTFGVPTQTGGMRPLRPGDAHQLEHLVAAGDVVLADDADTARVELHREHRLLEPAPLVAAHDAREGAGRHSEGGAVLDDPGLVLRVAAPELLAVRVGRVRVGGHDRARACAADAGLPGAFTALDRAVRA